MKNSFRIQQQKNEEIIIGRVIGIISVLSGIPKHSIMLHHRLNHDLNIDSLDAYNIVMELEDQFNIEIDDSFVDTDGTVRYYSDLVIRLKGLGDYTW
jgi:acyl carrier protein